VVIIADATCRRMVEAACQQVGIAVVAVTEISELERWPVDQIVVTDAAHLTPWWKTVGATRVILTAPHGSAAMVAVDRGATDWIQLPSTGAAIVGALLAAAAPSALTA
jgi:hypothetical protein